MRATIDGPRDGWHGDMGCATQPCNTAPRRAGRDPTIPTTTRFWDLSRALKYRRPQPAHVASAPGDRRAAVGEVDFAATSYPRTQGSPLHRSPAAPVRRPHPFSLTRFPPSRRLSSRASHHRTPHEPHGLFRNASRSRDELQRAGGRQHRRRRHHRSWHRSCADSTERHPSGGVHIHRLTQLIRSTHGQARECWYHRYRPVSRTPDGRDLHSPGPTGPTAARCPRAPAGHPPFQPQPNCNTSPIRLRAAAESFRRLKSKGRRIPAL